MSSAKLISSSQVQVAWIFHSQNGKGVHLRDSLYFICKLRSTSPALAYRYTPIRSQAALSCVLEFQKLEKNLVCFPVIPKGEFRYWCIICNCPLIDHVIRLGKCTMVYAGETTNIFLRLWLSHLVAMYFWEILLILESLESHL